LRCFVSKEGTHRSPSLPRHRNPPPHPHYSTSQTSVTVQFMHTFSVSRAETQNTPSSKGSQMVDENEHPQCPNYPIRLQPCHIPRSPIWGHMFSDTLAIRQDMGRSVTFTPSGIQKNTLPPQRGDGALVSSGRPRNSHVRRRLAAPRVL
jgi:hypothetical protein